MILVKFSSEFHLFNYSKKVFNTSKKPLTEQQEAELLTKCEEIYELHRILSQKELPIANAHLCDIPKAFAFRIGFELQNGTWNNEVFGWMERFSALARKLKESIDENEELQNKNRSYKYGNSYRKTIEQIKKLRKKEINVSAIETTTKYSLNKFREIVDECIKLKLNNIFIRPLTKLGKADSNRDKIGYSAEEFLEFYKNALEDYIIKKIRKEYF